MARLKLTLVLASGARIGPGKAALLESVRDTGSIAAAARAMGMDYKRAWLLIDSLNAPSNRYLHVIAFIAHQLYRMQDNLVDTLLATLQSHRNTCQREHKDNCYARRHQRDDQLAGLLETIDASIVRVLRRITQVVHDPTLTDAEKVDQVRHLLPADNDNEPAAMIALRQELDARQKQTLLAAIAGHFMLAWAHVNLLGEYDFSDETLCCSFGLRPARVAA